MRPPFLYTKDLAHQWTKRVLQLKQSSFTFPQKRLTIVFEPHTFSWRNRATLHWYDGVFVGADHVFLYKPPEHGSATHDQLSLGEIKDRIEAAHIPVTPFENTATGLVELINHTEQNDVILILSSGGMGGFIPQTILALEEKFPAKK
jgi:UDP-N-acetylmuramate: L-alanyl-gamma-D-glutamyl-meso-diaminopimelate ligase